MRKALAVISATALVCCLSACKGGDKQNSENIIVEKVVQKPQTGPQKMKDDEASGPVTWIDGAQYAFKATRHADENLATVKNNGVTYYDNVIDLAITRADGSVFFEKSFTKESFSSQLISSFEKTGVLLSMNLYKAEGNQLQFVVTVGSPDDTNDEVFCLLLVVDSQGGTHLEKYIEPTLDE